MRIALDAMGTDDAPSSEVSGAVGALEAADGELEIVLVGDEEKIRAELEGYSGYPSERLRIHHASQTIEAEDSPALAVRKKPDSSIVVGLKLQKNGDVDAFVSGGSTGAVMAASLLILRPLPGVDRPTVGTTLPTARDPLLLLDPGANIDCKPHHLVQFAQLGNIYAQDMMGLESPRVGLLNIGEEPEKGDELAVETYRLLSETDLNFIGNVEGRGIIGGGVDVLVCDGFVGNVLLKFYESVAEFIVALLRREIDTVDVELHLEDAFRVLDYAEYGGAPLLGVNGVSIVCHGQSPPKAIRNAIGVATQAVRSSMVSHIARELSGQRASSGATPR
ncbi:MAG: phosphate acyltransferase PlsX [Gemmatimonadota bacterium]